MSASHLCGRGDIPLNLEQAVGVDLGGAIEAKIARNGAVSGPGKTDCRAG